MENDRKQKIRDYEAKKNIAVIFLAVSLTVLANTISSTELSIANVLFMIYFVSFRITVFFVDIYTLNEDTKNGWYHIDHVLSVLLWFLWILAAIKLKDNVIISLHIIWIFLVISTSFFLVECFAWIITETPDDKTRPKCYWRWIFTNVAYIYYIPRYIYDVSGSDFNLLL